jgi:hypothetical protein
MSPEIGSVEGKEPSKKAKDNTYLDYPDKEMTIMGILTTFCLAVVALVLDRVGSAGKHPTMFLNLWQKQATYIVIGSLAVAAAGTLFYKQRSALAWHYGQISLSIECPGINKISTEDWYREADSWATRVPYQQAFTALAAGFACYAYALVMEAKWPFPALLFWSLIWVAGLWQLGKTEIYRRFPYEDDPQKIFRRLVRRKIHLLFRR